MSYLKHNDIKQLFIFTHELAGQLIFAIGNWALKTWLQAVSLDSDLLYVSGVFFAVVT